MAVCTTAAPSQPQCQVQAQPLHSLNKNELSSGLEGSSFSLDRLTRQTLAVSPNQDKLLLGGSIIVGDKAEYAAIAQVNLADYSVDFAKHYEFASNVSSLAFK